jgi:hypothetical protein
MTVVRTEHWVHVTKGRGLDLHPKYLRARRDIPAGMLFTVFGGVTVQERTQRRAFESFSTIHRQQHETEGAEKFQYSVQVGSEGVHGSSAWLIPHDDVPLLRRLMGQGHRNLRSLTGEGRESVGLGQYAQHSCCFDHVNAHIFPMFTLREEAGSTELRQGEDGEWMQLQGVALRANRLIKEGEEILIQYVGAGRSGHFRKVFDCTCC